MGADQLQSFWGTELSGISDEAIGWITIANGKPRAAKARTPQVVGNVSNSRSMECMVKLAEDELRRRRMRARFLPSELFGEGGWSILLDLFVSEHHGRKVSTTSACIAADVPGTTALRWLDVLESEGLIERSQTVSDKRVKYVSLTDEARSALTSLLARQASGLR